MTPIILELLPKENRKIDFSRFVVQYSNNPSCVDLSDYNVNYVQGSPIDHFREEFLEYIKKFGLHSYLGRQLLAEAIIRPGETQANIVDFLKLYIDAIEMDNELIIIDQHLFPGNVPAGYVDLIVSLLAPYFDRLQTLIVVTSQSYNQQLAISTITKLQSLSRSLQVFIRMSAEWHDRFWITNRRLKGIFVGTSLNGLGRKYACVDVLDETDVKDIVNGLKVNNLIK